MKVLLTFLLFITCAACNSYEGDTDVEEVTDTIHIEEEKIIIDSNGHSLPEDTVEI